MGFYLYILRHAKSDWAAGTRDFDRPINKRGQENAARIGQWMRDNQYIPEYVVASPAMRAEQTTKLVFSQIDDFDQSNIHFDKELYLANLPVLLELIQLYKNNRNSLMLIAHNPGLEQLLMYLSSKPVQADNKGKLLTTANLVIFEYPDNYFDAENDKAELIEFIKPKEFS